jgi:cell division protein ZapA (FtsZ GTPase activity inhibitor)
MDKLSIKINIANRFYPMKIERSSEENIRNAVKNIDVRLKFYEDNYEIRDKQDILAMCLIEYASKLEKLNNNTFINDDGISDKLSKLDELLSDID